jgi:hypothetical protein
MVRNEADIIEASVRWNLGTLDRLQVVDHCSVDGTGEILAALVAEGLPLAVKQECGNAQRQSEILTREARAAFTDISPADFVFVLDADEFLKARRRDLLERALESLPEGLQGALHWQTYVPEFTMIGDNQGLPIVRRRLAVERIGLSKVVLSRAFMRTPDAVLGPGSHTVLESGPTHDLATAPVRLGRLPAYIAALAHVPVRSAQQLVSKVRVGWPAHQAARRSDPNLAFHWREMHEEFANGVMPSPQRLREIALNYGVSQAAWLPAERVALVDDPLSPLPVARYRALVRPDAATAMLLQALELEREARAAR